MMKMKLLARSMNLTVCGRQRVSRLSSDNWTASLAGYRTAVDLLVQQIMAVSDLPAHMVGITTANPGSADGIRASEAGLTARAEARIRIVARAVEHIAQIMLAMDTGRLPGDYAPAATFANPGTRSTAQEADAVTKLHALGIIST